MNGSAIWAVIRNDLRLYRADRRAVMVGILVPILIAAFFGYVFGGTGNADTGRIPMVIVDEDQSDLSRALGADLIAEPMLSVDALDRSAAEQRVRSGTAHVAAIVPKDFGANAVGALLDARARPQVTLLIDPSQAMSARVVEGLFAQHGLQEITQRAFSGTAGMSRGVSIPYAIAIHEVTAGRQAPYNGYAHSFAGMTAQFILLAGIDAGIVMLMARERGIWQRLRSAPLSKRDFLVAKTAAGTLIGMFQFILIYTVAIAVFGVRISGSPAGFVLLAIAFCLLNATFGLMLSALGGSVGTTRGIALAATLLLVMLGGAWVPSFVFPHWLQQASLISPVRWAIDGFDGTTWRGLDFSTALPPLLGLSLAALVCLAIAIWRFRWEG